MENLDVYIGLGLVVFGSGAAWGILKGRVCKLREDVTEISKELDDGSFVRGDMCKVQHKNLEKQIAKIMEDTHWLREKIYDHIVKPNGGAKR